jgi:tetratricopeptide (TPR) repeat protein
VRATQLFESVLLQSDSPDDLQVLDARALQARTAGQYSLAISLAEEMVAQRRASDDRGRLSGGLRWSLFLLALMRREQGDLEGASVLFETMVQLHRGIGDREGIAIGLLGLSDISRDRGDTQQLRTYGGQSLLILRQLGVQWAIGFALNNLALAALWSGDLTGAAALIDEAVALFREQQAEGSLAEVLITQGQIYYAQGDGLTAQAVLREALGLALSPSAHGSLSPGPWRCWPRWHPLPTRLIWWFSC